jgi:hypothetical protein
MKKAERIEATYKFIVEFSETHIGHFPSHRLIGAAIGIKSMSLVNGYVADLEADGRVIRIDGLTAVAGARWIRPQVNR